MNRDLIISAPPPTHRDLTQDDKWDLVKFLEQIAWGVVFGLFTIPTYLDLGFTFAASIIWTSLVIGGAIMSAVGRLTFQHLTIELVGAFATLSGYLLYLAAQIVATIDDGSVTRLGLALLIVTASHPTARRFWYLLRKFLARFVGIGSEGVRVRRRGKR